MTIVLTVTKQTTYKGITMHTQVNFEGFKQAFIDKDRYDQFSNNALECIFEYYEEVEENTAESIELDVIAICFDWSEEPLQWVLDEYAVESFEELQEHTRAYMTDNNVIVYLPI